MLGMYDQYVNLIKTIPLAIALVGLIGTQYAYATNESSYQYGFRSADFARGSGCDDTDGDCDPSAVSNCNTQSANVTNQTACVDGFVNAWRTTCMSDLKLCAIQVLAGIFPGHVEDGKTMPTCYAKWDGPGSDDANTLVLPTHLVTVDHNDNPDSAYKACPSIRGNHN
jgi:hypothetical protein